MLPLMYGIMVDHNKVSSRRRDAGSVGWSLTARKSRPCKLGGVTTGLEHHSYEIKSTSIRLLREGI